MEDNLEIFVIGDPHFKSKTSYRSDLYINGVLGHVQESDPDIVVILGDVLHDHDTTKVQSFNDACRFIKKLSERFITYVLIGNHDYMNNSQMLTENHFFNPLKEWNNVFVIDKPTLHEIKSHKVVFCPYVPPGKFAEALDTLVVDEEKFDWKTKANCIFAHQEFKGCRMSESSSQKSTVGDAWSDSYPVVISGHIHQHQIIGKKIFYTGSSQQHAFDESEEKYLFMFTLEHGKKLQTEMIDFNVHKKKTLKYKVGEFMKVDVQNKIRGLVREPCTEYKIVISGTAEEIKEIKRSDCYVGLLSVCLFSFDVQKGVRSSNGIVTQEFKTYEEIFMELVKKEGKDFEELFKRIEQEV